MEPDLELNRDLILAHERRFAGHVAGEVVDKPVLALWMILIPVFFVFYFYQLKRYKSGLREFSKNFLVTRERVLEAVYTALRTRSEVDIDELVAVSDSPTEVKDEYRLWIEALVDHFKVLLRASGTNYEELVKGGYRKKSNYKLALNGLTSAEDQFNKALISYLPGDEESINQVVEAMGKSVREIRRSEAVEIFS